MILNHVGIINRNEEDAVWFYQNFLGLDTTRAFMVSPELSQQLFGFSREIKVLVFEKETIKIEVFIYPDFIAAAPNLYHIGLFVDNFAQLIAKARKKGIQVLTGDHSGRTVYFVKDPSGNHIEVKQKQNE